MFTILKLNLFLIEYFFKIVHLKGDIGVALFFAYQNGTNSFFPFFMIKEYKNNEIVNYIDLLDKYQINFNSRKFSYDCLLNDLVRISEYKVAFSTMDLDKKIFYIIIFEIYTKTSFFMKLYEIDLFSLYNIKFFLDVREHLFDQYLTFGFNYCNSNNCEELTDKHFSAFLIFSYPNSTDGYLNINQYLEENEGNTIDDININLTNNIKIENNIFGYIFSSINIVDLIGCDNLKLKSSSDNNIITKSYNLSENEIIKISFISNYKKSFNCSIYFRYIITEPSYSENKKYYVDILPEGVEYEEIYNSHKIEYLGRISIYKISYEYIETIIPTTIQSKCQTTIISDIVKNSYTYYTNDLIDEKTQMENRNESIQEILENLFNELNLTEIDNGEDKIIPKENLMFIFTSTENQKKNQEKNYVTMDLGQCGIELKSKYNISLNDSLYILQIISEEEGMKIPKLEYEVYYPLYNSSNLTKLNLSFCQRTKIEISISVTINDTLDKYDSKSTYYNDICSKTTSESGTDIILNDRRNEYVDNNMTLCEENCELIGYNYTIKKSICSCTVKSEIPDNYDIKFNKNDFFKSFIDIKNIANLNIIKCYKTVMKIKDLKENYGFFISSFIILLYFITLIIFSFNGYYKLKNEITDILNALKSNEDKNEEALFNNPEIDKIKIKKKIKIKIKKKVRKKNFITNANNQEVELENKINNNNYDGQITENNEGAKQAQKIKIMDMSEMRLEGRNINLNEKKLELKDFEINSLDYEEAIKLDKRKFYEYYFSLLKYNHPLTFSFATFTDYNSRIIKMFLFFCSFSLDFSTNTFFFNDNTMHKIYEDKGKYNFLYQIPQILYSAIISRIIDTIIKILALSQDNIVELKQEKENKDLDIRYNGLIRKLKIKFFLFFIIIFIILSLFWYYITCFCGIYVNSQIHLIKDSVISFTVGLLYPFVLYFIPGILRITALKAENQNRKCIYKCSSFIEKYLV